MTIGLGSAVSNILCRKHNSALSPFDQEASALSAFLTRNIVDDPRREDSIKLHGFLLEKWVLKTFLNLGYLQALHRDQDQPVLPSLSLIEYLFRGSTVSDGVGLYFVSGAVNNEAYTAGLSWNVIRNHNKLADGIHEILGCVFIFNGIRFALSIYPVHAEEKIVRMGKVGDFDYGGAHVYYRPDNIVMTSETAGPKRVELQW